jgi:formylglycine-generating enzyme required for sulfatase activity
MTTPVLDTTFIPEGWFWMGSENHYAWEKPRHRVWVDGFEMARTVVTRNHYREFLNATGWDAPAEWHSPVLEFANAPVVGVSWFDAVRYCEWFSAVVGGKWRLPTEAEWEKACRGGLEDAAYSWGDDAPSSIEYFCGAWPGPRPVSAWQANGFGLWNIGCNVHEWCTDWYSEN